MNDVPAELTSLRGVGVAKSQVLDSGVTPGLGMVPQKVETQPSR